MADVIEGEFECQNLGLYLEKSSVPLLQAVYAKKWFSSESKSEYKAHRVYKNNWLRKALHGQFCKETATHIMLIISNNAWSWPKFSRLSPEVEGYLFAAQEQAITTKLTYCWGITLLFSFLV